MPEQTSARRMRTVYEFDVFLWGSIRASGIRITQKDNINDAQKSALGKLRDGCSPKNRNGWSVKLKKEYQNV